MTVALQPTLGRRQTSVWASAGPRDPLQGPLLQFRRATAYWSAPWPLASGFQGRQGARWWYRSTAVGPVRPALAAGSDRRRVQGLRNATDGSGGPRGASVGGGPSARGSLGGVCAHVGTERVPYPTSVVRCGSRIRRVQFGPPTPFKRRSRGSNGVVPHGANHTPFRAVLIPRPDQG